jgi:hypothetical protein
VDCFVASLLAMTGICVGAKLASPAPLPQGERGEGFRGTPTEGGNRPVSPAPASGGGQGTCGGETVGAGFKPAQATGNLKMYRLGGTRGGFETRPYPWRILRVAKRSHRFQKAAPIGAKIVGLPKIRPSAARGFS